MWKILIFELNFVAKKFKQIAKIGFEEGKKPVEPWMICSHLDQQAQANTSIPPWT